MNGGQLIFPRGDAIGTKYRKSAMYPQSLDHSLLRA